MRKLINYAPAADERPISTVQITKEPCQLALTGVPAGHELLLLAVSKKKNPDPKWKEVSNTAWTEVFFVIHHPKDDQDLDRCRLHAGMAGSLYEMCVKAARIVEKGELHVLYVDDVLAEEGILYITKGDEEGLPPTSSHPGYTGPIEVIDHTMSYFELSTETVKPSDFDISKDFDDSLGQSEQELVARRVIMMLKHTGDKWRPFTLKDYNGSYGKDVSDQDIRGLRKLASVGRLNNQDGEFTVTDQLIEDLEEYIIK
jgi:hypothetical protein